MFSQTQLAVIAGTLSIGLAAAFPADAATTEKTLFMDPSSSCQLSIPTTTSAIRPRATGVRNEGAETAFIICGLPRLFSTDLESTINIQMAAFDGIADSVNCTAVNRQSSGGSVVFAPKTVAIPASGSTSTTWTGAELGGAATLGFAFSITCALPQGVGIVGVRINFPDEIGS
jgi:hypothetical protein